MTKMATDPLLFFVAIFGELAIFEVGHIPEDALKKPYKYEDGHEIAVREREKDSLGKKRRWPHDTKMATKRNRGMLAKFAVGNFGRSP